MQSDLVSLPNIGVRTQDRHTSYHSHEVELPNFEKDVLILPLKILRFFGLLPSTSKTNLILKYSFICFYLIHFLGGLIGCTHQFITTYFRAIQSDPSKYINSIIWISTSIPYVADYIRALGVLALFYRSQKLLPVLFETAVSLLSKTNLRRDLKKLLEKWRRLVVSLSTLSLFLHAVWESSGWGYYVQSSAQKDSNGRVNLSSNGGNQSQPQTPSILSNLSNLRAYFEFVYFVLSQQVVIVSIILTLALKNCLAEFGGQIMRFKNYLNCEETDCPSRRVILVEVLRLQELHMDILCFVENLNYVFSPIHCFMYLLDFVTCMGFFVGLIAGESNVPMFFYCFYFSILIFGAYATILFVPLIQVYEEVS
jgi:hypothetical protein